MCGPNDWRQVEQKIYFDGNTGGDTLTLYQGGGRHNDGCPCCGFAHKMGFASDGLVELRKETWHVHYDDMEETNIGGLGGGYNGVALCRFWVGTDGVRCEAWVDKGRSGSWSMALGVTDTPGAYGSGGGRCGGPDQNPGRWGFPAVVYRCDDFSYDFQNMAAREIDPGGSFSSGTPGQPTTGGPQTGGVPAGDGGTMGDGGGGAGNDYSTGTAQAFAGNGCAIATAGGVTATAGICRDAGTGSDITAGNTSQGPTGEEPPIITVYKDLGVAWNVRIDSGDGCGISGTTNNSPYVQIYQASGSGDDDYINLFSNGITETGAKVHAKKSVLYDKILRKVTVLLKRSSGTLTGNIYCIIRDREGNLMTTFDTTVNPAGVPTAADQSYDFEHPSNTYKMRAGDSVLIQYTEGNTSDHIKVKHQLEADVADGFNTIHIRKVGLTYETHELEDFAATIYR